MITTSTALLDADTATVIGTATLDQILASTIAATQDGGCGIILIDSEGTVLYAGTWEARVNDTRRVYTEADESIFLAYVADFEQDCTVERDIRTMDRDELQALHDQAGSAGDMDLVQVATAVLDYDLSEAV